MREVIGCWPVVKRGRNGCFAGFDDYEVSLEDGVLTLRPCGDAWGARIAFKRAFGERYFGDSEFLVGCIGEYVDKILFSCVGKRDSEIREVVQKYVDYRKENRTKDDLEREQWEILKEKFDGAVIGLDKKIDVYETGFSVRVLFSSDMTFAGKAKFLRENRAEFIKWTMREIFKSARIMSKIGSMKFYRPVEIVNLRAQEVEVKFEVKKEVA